MGFENLTPELRKIVAERFSNPTKAQALAIEPILKGENILLIAPTGGGKTESVLLPLFDKWTRTRPQPISMLYITPLKSLNRDLLDRISWWSARLGFGVSVRHGDTTQHERKLQTENPDDLLITTAEQLQAMLVGEKMKALLRNVKWVVVDEIHELADSKRGVQLTVALERLRELCGSFQIACLSATVGSPEAVAKFIFGGVHHKILDATENKKLEIIVDSPVPDTEDKILSDRLFIGDAVAARVRAMHDLILGHTSSLIFTNTREAAEILSSRLKTLDKNLPIEVHHGSLSKDIRIEAERGFKSQKIKAIICTSSLQLGIDIGSVDLVVQYMSPRDVGQFTQRLGRAGHSLEKTSKGIILAGDYDDILEAAVIARKTADGELEAPRIYEKPLDVLAHQIVGLAMSDYRIRAEAAYEIIRRASPYKDITLKEFNGIVQFLDSVHLLFTDNGLSRKRRAFDYYFGNMSTIPDSKNYKVVDMASNTPVGTLDEAFVAEHSESGSTFVMKGRPWRLVEIEGGKVFVEPVGGLESAIPAWEGELIPVPFSISQEVGRLRGKIAAGIRRGRKDSELVAEIRKRYPVTANAASAVLGYVKSQLKNWPVPDDKNIVIEAFREFTVVHCLYGSLVNETLARFVSSILSSEQGRIITSKSDPYRIIFGNVKPEDVMRVLKAYKLSVIGPVLSLSLPNSSLFKHRFLQVAKRIGAIRKDADYKNVNIDKIIKTYHGSPVFLETLNEIFTEKLDLEKAEHALENITSGKTRMTQCAGLSPMGEAGLKYELTDIARPDRPESEILKVFKSRLLSTRQRLVCISCGNYSEALPVKETEAEPRCPKCTSKLLACVHPYMTEAQEIIRKRLKGKDLTNEELRKLERIRRSADMVIVYGKRACITLAGRGVGPQTAARILARMSRTEDEFYKHVLQAERDFIRTKKFWSD